ncbi:MAG: ATP synthase F0 subunit B [Desulfobacca sp.]|nr:ATP synthase F0 subunit B [Desulfobacca sp.]
MIELNWTLYVQIINFLLLVFVLNQVLFRPIRGALRDRQARIMGFEGDIASLTENHQQVEGSIQAELTAARKSGFEKREMIKKEGSDAESSLLERVKKEADAEWEQMEKKIKEDMAKAREALKPQAQSFALELAAKILGRAMA